jgi:hypothetical protein
MQEYMAKYFQFAWLRQMLLNRQQPDAKYMTGGNMAKMLSEMEQMKQVQSPYTTGAKDIEREARSLLDKLQNAVSVIEQMWSFGTA